MIYKQCCYDIGVSIGMRFISDNFKKYRILGIRYFLRYLISDIEKYKKKKKNQKPNSEIDRLVLHNKYVTWKYIPSNSILPIL